MDGCKFEFIKNNFWVLLNDSKWSINQIAQLITRLINSLLDFY